VTWMREDLLLRRVAPKRRRQLKAPRPSKRPLRLAGRPLQQSAVGDGTRQSPGLEGGHDSDAVIADAAEEEAEAEVEAGSGDDDRADDEDEDRVGDMPLPLKMATIDVYLAAVAELYAAQVLMGTNKQARL